MHLVNLDPIASKIAIAKIIVLVIRKLDNASVLADGKELIVIIHVIKDITVLDVKKFVQWHLVCNNNNCFFFEYL